MKKNIVILGSTGSIGRQALEVVGWHSDKLNVLGIAAQSNIDLLEKQSKKYQVSHVVVEDEDAALELEARLRGTGINCMAGTDGVLELVRHSEVDLVLVAVSGLGGLLPTMEAIANNKQIALANKETLVAGGSLVMDAAIKQGVNIIPVDSEHSAIFQCLEDIKDVEKLIITASGGPFRGIGAEELKTITPEMALCHPTWQMGKKITIDSATLMNKGLEIIEAHWLFGIDYDSIEAVIHPQSIIHSLVVYKDGAVLAQLGWPDMRVPIQYAFFYPEREKNDLPHLDLTKVGQMTFDNPDLVHFPCLSLAREAGKIGGTMTTVLNAANEVAVQAFLEYKIAFTRIPELIEKVMSLHQPKIGGLDLDDVLGTDGWARECTANLIRRYR